MWIVSDTPSAFDLRFDALTPAQQELVYLRLRDVVETRLIARTRRAVEGRKQRTLQPAAGVNAVIKLN